MLIGYLVVKAEPAVYVLMRQVEELPNLSKAKAIETIKEGVKMREQG